MGNLSDINNIILFIIINISFLLMNEGAYGWELPVDRGGVMARVGVGAEVGVGASWLGEWGQGWVYGELDARGEQVSLGGGFGTYLYEGDVFYVRPALHLHGLGLYGDEAGLGVRADVDVMAMWRILQTVWIVTGPRFGFAARWGELEQGRSRFGAMLALGVELGDDWSVWLGGWGRYAVRSDGLGSLGADAMLGVTWRLW